MEELDIITRIVVDPDAAVPTLNRVEGKVDGVGRRVDALSNRFNSMLALAGASMAIYKLGQVTQGVVGLHTAMQNAQIGMAGLFSAMSGRGVEQTLGLARDVVGQLRQDAASGAGELQDYVDAYQRIVGPARAAGASLEQVRELTKMGLGAGFAMGGQQGLKAAGADIVQGLAGGLSPAESQVLGPLLGMTGSSLEALNKAKGVEKVELVLDALRKMEPGIKAVGKTWEAQMSTLQDNVKGIIMDVSAPLFERWSQQLVGVNEWLTANKDTIAETVQQLGPKLLSLWDQMIAKADTLAKLSAGGLVAGAAARSGMVGAAGAAVGGVGTAGLAAAAGVLGVVAAAGYGVAAAFERWPLLLTQLRTGFDAIWVAVRGLADALLPLGSLMDDVLSQVGFAGVEVGKGLLVLVELFVRFGTSMVNLVGVLGQSFISFLDIWMGLASAEDPHGYLMGVQEELLGNISGAFDPLRESIALTGPKRSDSATPEDPEAMYEALGFGLGMALPDIAGAGAGMGKPKPAKPPPTIIQVKIDVETAQDPYRVATTIKKVLENASKFRTSAAVPALMPR